MNNKTMNIQNDISEMAAVSQREKRSAAVARRAAAEGMVLLKNDNNILPLSNGRPVAVYGGGALYTVKGGTGSGAVNNRYNISIVQGLEEAGFRILNTDWLQDYQQRYEAARASWMQEIYANSKPGDFDSLYRAHATTPLAMPKGKEITKCGTDTAIYVISRISGEGADRRAVPGDYYLSETERNELERTAQLYPHVVVILNIGGVMDTAFAGELQVEGLVLMCQAGQEGGRALADVLTGKVNPSGRFTDTWAVSYADYPSSANFSHNNGNIIEEKYTDGIYVGYRYFDSFAVKPRYRFGYGLSYTTFATSVCGHKIEGDALFVDVRVENTGRNAGKETVFVYASTPGTLRQRPLYTLIGFAKTDLIEAAGSENIQVRCELDLLNEYHTGKSQWQLEEGEYYILTGNTADPAGYEPTAVYRLDRTLVTRKVKPVCPLLDALKEIYPDQDSRNQMRSSIAARFSAYQKKAENEGGQGTAAGAAVEQGIAEEDLLDYLAEDQNGIFTWKQDNAATAALSGMRESDEGRKARKERAKEIVSQISVKEKALLCCGRLKEGTAEFIGNASVTVPGAAGETTAVLKERYGVENIVLADGPAGLRLWQIYETDRDSGEVYSMTPYEGLENRIFGKQFLHEDAQKHYQYCTAFPVGMLLAQTFDLQLLEEVGEAVGEEMEEFHVALWLAPGMNIHRNPLCGRNYEYYSEDPLVSGLMAAAITRGVQKRPNLGTTIKHYACNNQEENRRGVSSIVSEQALRELYLKGFEIAVRKSQPKAIMTSYNKVNGVHTANSYDLCTELARNEWGFEGIIMTDWTTTNSDGGSSAAKCIAAGNDLVMPGNMNDVREIIDAVHGAADQALDEADLDACAERMIEAILS